MRPDDHAGDVVVPEALPVSAELVGVRFVRGVSLLVAGTIATQACTAIAFWFTARNASPAAFGNATAVIAVALMVSDLFDLGTNSVLVRDVASRVDGREQRRLISELLGVKVGFGAVALVLWAVGAVVAERFGADIGLGVLLGIFVAATIVSTTSAAALRAVALYGRCSIVSVVERAVMASVTITLGMTTGLGANALIGGLCSGAVVSAAVGYVLLPRDRRGMGWPNYREARRVFRAAVPFGAIGLVTNLQRIDITLVRIATGATGAGLFAAASRIIQPFTSVSTATYLVLFPRLAATSDFTQRQIDGRRAAKTACIVAAVSVLPFMVFAPLVIRTLLGPAYAAAAPGFRLMLLAVVLAATNQPLLALLQASHRAGLAARAILGSTVGGLTCVFGGAALGGVGGAAIGVVLLQASMLLLLVRAERSLRVEIPS